MKLASHISFCYLVFFTRCIFNCVADILIDKTVQPYERIKTTKYQIQNIKRFKIIFLFHFSRN